MVPNDKTKLGGMNDREIRKLTYIDCPLTTYSLGTIKPLRNPIKAMNFKNISKSHPIRMFRPLRIDENKIRNTDHKQNGEEDHSKDEAQGPEILAGNVAAAEIDRSRSRGIGRENAHQAH